MLREAGRDDVADDLVSVDAEGFEAQADWANLESPETYLGYEQAQNFASPGGAGLDEPRTYVVPDRLGLNQWACRGTGRSRAGASVLNEADGRIAFRFHARDVNLVHGAARREAHPSRSVCSSTENLPATLMASTSTNEGDGTVSQQRLYQLIREPGSITDRTFEITFLAPGVEAYVFTFG